MKKTNFVLFVLVLALVPLTGNCSSRGSHRFGLYGDYNFGTKLVGANVGLNATDWLRLHFGYAFPRSSSHRDNFDAQAQGGVKFLFPHLDLTPFAGVASGASSGTLTLNVGLDYTTHSGWNMGGGWAHVDTDGANGAFVYFGKYF